ncbi:hypothetical protein BSKO_00225 [Bryopsis sp. KO-2023]|nr:hypothetical protein BSKO_00225 [Bryopsis sp. KO-2023]
MDDSVWDQTEEEFDDAADYVQHWAAQGVFQPDTLLQLYGFYKQATVGPCPLSKPYIWQREALAKWHVWQVLGDMSKSEAQGEYVELLSACRPDWQDWTQESGGGPAAGPVFSRPVEEGTEPAGQSGTNDNQMGLCGLAMRGDTEGVSQLIENAENLNQLDEEGRTGLHWAADRAHVEIVNLLLEAGLDPNLQDKEGQTSLHYAALCEHEEVAHILLKFGAKNDVEDECGDTPQDLAPKEWEFMKGGEKQC